MTSTDANRCLICVRVAGRSLPLSTILAHRVTRCGIQEWCITHRMLTACEQVLDLREGRGAVSVAIAAAHSKSTHSVRWHPGDVSG
jgi:hypothetical protein